MEDRSKHEMLYALAEQDSSYKLWKKCFEDCVWSFCEFADNQPEEIRNILYGYADCGRMMMQRMINIACENMEFNGNEK